MSNNIYILVPHAVRTGGPEALLQLSDALLRSGYKNVHVVFYDNGQTSQLRQISPESIGRSTQLVFGCRDQKIDEYAHYKIQITGEVYNTPESIVILPEVLADLIPHFCNARVVLWWLSVDNAFAALAKINLNHLRRENIFHATQSAYALRTVNALGLNHAGHLSDYTSELFSGDIPLSNRPPLIAISAGHKVVVDLSALESLLRAAQADIQIQRIVGMDRETVVKTLRQSRVFIDLGNFPGKDRLAREAALLGCAVIVADAGAGSTDEDYATAPEDRQSPWHLDEVCARAIDLVRNPIKAIANNDLLATRVRKEKELFFNEASSIIAKAISPPPPPCQEPHRKELLSLVPSNNTSDTTPDDTRYAIWRSRQSIQEIDAHLLAERMVLKWHSRPGIHLLMPLYPGEENLLADTLDSLAAQLYPEWLLTVVTDLSAPAGVADVPNMQWLSLRDAKNIDYVINEMAAASPGAWLGRIEPGITLEPQALQVFADYINAHPKWRLIYCDEDTRESDGSYSTPLFKPDLNLDLLRAQAYFGCLVLAEKTEFLASGCYGPHNGAENYDLSLRILDHTGPDGIGHVAQLLAHLPRDSKRSMCPASERQALAEHFERNQLDASIFDGMLFGTRRIEYHWPQEPLVSIIIPTRDREEYLRPLINSMRELTRYPNYEIIIVDNDSDDPDSVRYLRSITTTTDTTGPAIRVIPCSGEFNWSNCANTGAEAARGDYILFLDNDMHVVQEEWLSRLMGIAQRPDVAIVAPRLSYPETGKVQQGGLILGLGGSVASPWDKEQNLTAPGYMGRALCDQNLSAASGSALLIKRNILIELGGFDTEHFPLVFGAVDLCLRTTRLGYRIVWAPHSILVHYGSVSIQVRQRKLENRLDDWLRIQRSQDALLDRWLAQLAHDPAYNRNLSLVDAYKPEHISPIDWDPHFHDRPRILAIPVPGGAGEYRLRAPLRAIGQAGLAQTMICEPIDMTTVRILTPIEIARAEPDVLIVHQPISDPQSDATEAYVRHLPKVRRILTIDDLIIDLPKKHPMYKSGYKDGKQRLRKNLSLMHRLVVSTQPLADLCSDMIDDIRVMPNCLEWALWQDATPPRLPRKKPRVGWAGAQQHQGDLELIYPVVEALANDVDWIFMGMCPDELKPFVRESHGFERDFRAYPKALARLDLDLAIAPLEIHAFNEAKSNLRLLEYGFMGWPVICTDIYPYQNAPVTRLPNVPEKWIATIREQLANPEALKAAGCTLRDWVLNGFILEEHVESWFAAYGT